MIRRVFAIGETVFDIIFKDEKPVDAYPGGSMLNAAVSLGKIDIPVSLLTEISNDLLGKLIIKFLDNNHVNTNFIAKYDGFNTPVALAFLDKDNNAKYQFYKNYPKDRLNIEFPKIVQNDILLFGSIYSITFEIRDKINQVVENAKNSESIIIYDPNFRKSHLQSLPEVKKLILENISNADIIRGSDEDFKLIFNAGNADETFDAINKINKILIYTSKNKGVWLRSKKHSFMVPVPKIKIISSIGAGDSFNAGIIYSIFKHNVNKKDLNKMNEEILSEILKDGIAFASNVCQSYENYINDDFANILKI